MRLRKKKNASSRYDACLDWILTKDTVESWCNHPHLALEIGSGKGGFITKLAEQNPSVRYIAVEKEVDCIVMALEKAKAANLENLRFVAIDAKELSLFLPRQKFDTIYLNFSDPWPKKKYGKRRLTHRNLLRRFLPLLNENGEVRFKTDNDKLFEFSVEEWKDLEMDITFLTYDLHKQDIPNIMTEYETRFSQMGTPIKSMWARPTDKTFAHLEAYTQLKDVFAFHQLIIDIGEPIDAKEQALLWRALDNIGVRMAKTARTCEAVSCPFIKFTTDSFVPKDIAYELGGTVEETALISDDARHLVEAAKKGLYTIALGEKQNDILANEHWYSLSKENLHKKD